MGWLFGAIGRAGIQLPKSFDIAGIFDLVMQVLGLTYRQIRARVVKLVGEKVVTKLEQTVDVFKVLVTEGIPGLWKWIKDKVGDLEEMVIGGIKTFIIEKVIKAGITWLIAFLNPAAAFIKACKMIYDVIMFIIERGSEIMDFVRSILDSIGAIAKGNIGIVAQKVEDSLARALPLAISFLASLLGLGGISEKIQSIIHKVQAPIGKAVDTVVMGAVKGAKKLFGGAAKWVKGKAKKAKDWAKTKLHGGDDSQEGKQKRLEAGMSAAVSVASRFSGKIVGERTLKALFAPIRMRYGMTSLFPVRDGDGWAVEGTVNPKDKKKLDAKAGEEPSKDDRKAEQKAKQELKKAQANARSLTASVRKQVADLNGSKAQNQLAKAGEGGARTKTDIQALTQELDGRKAADNGTISKGDVAALVKLKEDFDAYRARANALEQAITVLDPAAAGDQKTQQIKDITGHWRGVRDTAESEEVKAFLAEVPQAKADLDQKMPPLPGLESEAAFNAWAAKLPEKDLPALQELAKHAAEVGRFAQDLKKRAVPNTADQRPKPFPGPSRLRLVNPADVFPGELCSVIDLAHTTLNDNNKQSGKWGDKSTQFAAIAEAVYDGPLPGTGGREHEGKTEGIRKAYAGYKAKIEQLIEKHPKSKPMVAGGLEVLQREIDKCDSAIAFCKDPTGPYPSWVDGASNAQLNDLKAQRAKR